MLSRRDFIQMSLELNLFFGRILKEHMIFMQISLPIKNSDLILEADQLKKSFEELLMETISLADGAIAKEAIDSNEIVTPYTLKAENIVESLTGVCIDQNLTLAEMRLTSRPDFDFSPELEQWVSDLNDRAINLVMEIIKFNEKVLEEFLDCHIFIFIYPDMLEHLLRETKFYLETLIDIQERKKPKKDILGTKKFWDHIMEEHALFIRGLLDPSEKALFNKANNLAEMFEKLLEEIEKVTKEEILKVIKKNLKATMEIKEFKTRATEGLIECEIKSLINPLLSDHVLREANRYIRVLKTYLKD